MSKCIHCQQEQSRYSKCEICNEQVCRHCEVRPQPERLKYWRVQRPKVADVTLACPRCFDEYLVPLYEQYDALMDTASDSHYFPKAYRGKPPVLKKSRVAISVENFEDRDEVLNQLQFDAAQMGFGGLIDVEITGEKRRINGYQKTIWRGRALPVDLDREKIDRYYE